MIGWVVNAQYSIQMVCPRAVHSKLYNFINQCPPYI